MTSEAMQTINIIIGASEIMFLLVGSDRVTHHAVPECNYPSP